MLSSSILVRESDKKEFRITLHGHWSDIVACDGSGEVDRVKWTWGSGGPKDPEHYVSNRKGHGYIVKPR